MGQTFAVIKTVANYVDDSLDICHAKVSNSSKADLNQTLKEADLRGNLSTRAESTALEGEIDTSSY